MAAEHFQKLDSDDHVEGGAQEVVEPHGGVVDHQIQLYKDGVEGQDDGQGDNDADDDLQDLRDAVDDVGERFSQAAEGVHMGSSLSVQNLAAAARKPSTSSAVVAKQVTKRMTVVSGVGPGHQSS